MEIKRHTAVTIILDETEAAWLKDFMQNPLYKQNIESERDSDKKNEKGVLRCFK